MYMKVTNTKIEVISAFNVDPAHIPATAAAAPDATNTALDTYSTGSPSVCNGDDYVKADSSITSGSNCGATYTLTMLSSGTTYSGT